MENQQSREFLVTELRRQGLPRAYIQRLLEELDDHLADLQDERSPDMDTARKPESITSEVKTPKLESARVLNFQERLGNPVQLADFAAKQYHNRSFLGRHPILTFLVLPLPLIILELVAIFLSLCLLGTAIGGWLEGFVELDHPLLGSIMLALLARVVIVLPPLGTDLLICRLARCNTLNWRWPIAACCLVALFCAVFYVSWSLPTAPGNGQFMIGFDLSSAPLWMLLSFLPKFALALGVGLLLVKRAMRLQTRGGSHEEITALRSAA